MFDQSFVSDSEGAAKRPLSVLAALAIQIGVLAVLAFASLAYVGRIPIAQLRAMLMRHAPLCRAFPCKRM